MSTNPNDNLSFPIWIQGVVDGQQLNAPFISGMIANSFIEGLQWASEHLAATVNVVIYVHGEEAQKIEFQPVKH